MELNGDVPFDSTITLKSPLQGSDGSFAPLTSTASSFTAATVGINWQAKKRLLRRRWRQPGISRRRIARTSAPKATRAATSSTTSSASASIPARTAALCLTWRPPPRCKECAPENRPPTVKANCGTCVVYINESLPVTSTGNDPDSDQLTYRWNGVAGRFDNNASQNTSWTAPAAEGPVDLTVTVDDGHQHTASDMVRVRVMKRELPPLQFEDVYFDFDRYSLRPEATRLLDDAVRQLQAQPDKKIIIEGHTCNIGTAEYNLALGDRRARASSATSCRAESQPSGWRRAATARSARRTRTTARRRAA